MFGKIDSLLKKLNSYRPLTASEVQRLSEEFLINFTYNSNAIEGNTLTLQETALVLQEGITIAQKPLKEHLEAIGHKEAFKYIEEIVKEPVDISERVIKDIHSLVLMDRPQDRGIYRRVPVIIQGAEKRPPEPHLVPSEMEGLIKEHGDWKQNMHVVERVALFHLRFEEIHPFVDGNGRMGRLLLNFELMKSGYPPINIKFQDRKSYYDCFNDYQKSGGNPTAMVALVSDYIEEELENYIEILEMANSIDDMEYER